MIYEGTSLDGKPVRGEELTVDLGGTWITHRESHGYRSTKIDPNTLDVIEDDDMEEDNGES